jgi:site-specific DNA recombinase
MLNEKAAHPRGEAINRTTGLLMGRLFDEHGEPLYSCWAKKGERRYRYFVSRKLVRGSKMPDDRGWRLPAERTEEAVTAAALQILSDRAALASTLKTLGLYASELKQALEAIDSKVRSFRQIGTMEDSGTIIERVELKRDGMQITLNLGSMLRLDQLPHRRANLRMTRLVPMQLRRRGVETRMVIPGEAVTASRTDPALLRALARAAIGGSGNWPPVEPHQPNRSRTGKA